MGSFWSRAINALAQTQEPEPEPPALTADDIELSNWEAHRGELGIRDNSDFIGVARWQRPQHYVHHEETELEKYAAQRAQLGVREAPQASAGNPRKYDHPYGTAGHTIRN
jgi:hypothetical protein